MSEKKICPFCNRSIEEVKREEGNIIIYECPECGNLLAAYLKEYHDLLRNFFKRYRLDTFRPKLPEGIKKVVYDD